METINTVNNLSISYIRENWNNIDIEITNNIIDNAWNNWYEKFNIDKDDFYVNLFKNFIMNNEIITNNFIVINDGKLILKNLTSFERKEVHKLCDKIGLHHNSIIAKKNKKHLHIMKPSIWKWEYSEPNPYSEAPEVYKQREEECEERDKRRNQRLKRIECYNCSANALETELYHSVYIRGIYCEDCLGDVSDGDGGVLNDHKFEPL